MTSSSDDSDSDWAKQKSPSKRSRKISGDEDGRKSKNSATFIQKVFEMANCKKHCHAIGFSDDGLSLEIRNGSLLGPILSQYFRHGHTASFIRQLNNYGFKTISSPSSGNDRHVFAHANFKRDDRTLLGSITRKAAMREKKKSKADVIKELQQRESEQRTRMMQLEARHHDLMQRTLLLDSENRNLKAMWKSVDHKQQHSFHPQQQLDLHHQPQHHPVQATYGVHLQLENNSNSSYDFSNHRGTNSLTPIPGTFDQIASPFGSSNGTNPNSPVFVDTLHHMHHNGGHSIHMEHLNIDIVMSPMASSSSPDPTHDSIMVDSHHHGLEYDTTTDHHQHQQHPHHPHIHSSIPQA